MRRGIDSLSLWERQPSLTGKHARWGFRRLARDMNPRPAHVCYEVELRNDPSLDARLDDFMLERHIPDIYDTHCFYRISYQRVAQGQARTLYFAVDQGTLEHYLREYSAPLRVDFLAAFPTGVEVSRQVWNVRCEWE